MIIKNNTQSIQSWFGIDINPNQYFLVPKHLRQEVASNQSLIQAVSQGDAKICTEANLSGEIENLSEALAYLFDQIPKKVDIATAKDSEERLIITSTPFSNPSGFRFRGSSFKDTVQSNQTKNIDFKITQERWIDGGMAIVDNVGQDDQITFQVVDKDNILGLGAGIILDEFISGFYFPLDGKLEIKLAYPAKIISGLYLRLKYTSTHELGCTIKCNLYLHWKAT